MGWLRFRSAAPAVLMLLLAGCAGLAGIEDPRVSLAGLRPLEAGLFEQRVEVSLRIANPNDVPLELDGLSFTIEVNGDPLAEGMTGERISLPRLGESVVRVTATSSMLSLARQILTPRADGPASYRIAGKAYLVDGPVRSVSFAREGRLGLTDK